MGAVTDSDLPKKFATWMGIDRREIDWHPSIDGNRCEGCGLCVKGCGRNVLGYDEAAGVSAVENPLQCKVGCTTCGTYCPNGAIEFPDEENVGELIREHGLIAWARDRIRNEYESNGPEASGR